MAIAKLSTPEKVKKGPPCGVCLALRTLPADESAALQTLLEDPTWRYTALSKALKDDPDTPLDLAPHQLGNHVRGGCDNGVKLR